MWRKFPDHGKQDILPGMGTPKQSALRNREYLRCVEKYFV